MTTGENFSPSRKPLSQSFCLSEFLNLWIRTSLYLKSQRTDLANIRYLPLYMHCDPSYEYQYTISVWQAPLNCEGCTPLRCTCDQLIVPHSDQLNAPGPRTCTGNGYFLLCSCFCQNHTNIHYRDTTGCSMHHHRPISKRLHYIMHSGIAAASVQQNKSAYTHVHPYTHTHLHARPYISVLYSTFLRNAKYTHKVLYLYTPSYTNTPLYMPLYSFVTP